MDLGLAGKVAVITGASSGFGKACAKVLAKERARVVICARNEGRLERAKEELREQTAGEIMSIKSDLTKPDNIRALISNTVAAFGSVDILVTNSGAPPKGRFMELSDQDWYLALDLFLMSVIRLCREVIPFMEKQEWGRIINLTSTAVKQPLGPMVSSSVARIGVLAVSKALADAYASKGICVHTVCPGSIMTEGHRAMFEQRASEMGRTPEEVSQLWLGEIPMRRHGCTEELASVVAFLASEKSSYMTGGVIQIDGGRIRSYF